MRRESTKTQWHWGVTVTRQRNGEIRWMINHEFIIRLMVVTMTLLLTRGLVNCPNKEMDRVLRPD